MFDGIGEVKYGKGAVDVRFETESATELSNLIRYVEGRVKSIERSGGRIVDVDFLIDNKKMFPYRVVIKYVGGR